MTVTAVKFDATIGAIKEHLWSSFAFIVATITTVEVLLAHAVNSALALVGLNGRKSIQEMIQKNTNEKTPYRLLGFHAFIALCGLLLLEAKQTKSFVQKIAPTKARRFLSQLSIVKFAGNLLVAKKRMVEATLILFVFVLKTVQINLNALEALIKTGMYSITKMVSLTWNIASLCQNILEESFKNMKTCITKMVCVLTTELKIWSCGARNNPKGSVSKIKSHGASSFFVNMVILSRAGQVTKFNFLD
jgi:hypothetical protein